jgi:hypothetical protein
VRFQDLYRDKLLMRDHAAIIVRVVRLIPSYPQ